jgi:hypothetical protein
MEARKLIFSISCLFFALSANDFYDINELIQDQEYSQALEEMEETKLSLITKKRLLAQLAKQWSDLSLKNQKQFNVMLLDLLPADQVFIENIRDRALELEGKEEGEEVERMPATPGVREAAPKKVMAEEREMAEEEVAKPVVAKPKVVAPQKVTAAPAGTKKMKQTQKPGQKMMRRKKPMMKKAPVKKEMPPVIPAQKVQPMEINIRQEL